MCAMFRNASHFPSEGSLGGLISGLSGALRQVGDAAASVLGGRGVRMDEDGQGPFEAAVQAAAGSGNDTDAMMAALSKHSVRLTPLIKRRVFPDLPGVPRGVALGWAQLTSGEGATVSIGLFIGHDRFSQIALADGNGRVFVTSDPHADTHDMKPRFMLVKEEELDALVKAMDGKPGDLLFYASGSYINHVGIYVGNGKIIHSSTPATGICYTPSNYRTPCKAVTFFD